MKKKLLILFLLLILLKIILSIFIQFPLGFSDSLTYQESAKTFFDTLDITKMAESKYPFLYSLIISPAFFFEDMNIVMLIIRIINSILSSLIIFPIYLLAKEFFNKKNSFLIAVICGFIPPFFIFTFTSMSENLFYPLFIFSIYAIYKSFNKNNLKWSIIAGVLIGLTLLTKILGIILIPVIIIMLLFNIKQYKTKLLLLFSTFIISLTWIIPRLINSGFNLIQATGYQPSIEKATSGIFLTTKLIWFFLYIDYLILASGIFLFIFALVLIIKYKHLNKKQKILLQITLLSTLFLLIICANHSGSFENYKDYKTIGRYIECLIPIYLILGFIQLEKNEKPNRIFQIIIFLFTIFTSYFILFDKFFPLNNSSLIHIGILKYSLEILSLNSKIIILILIILIIPLILLIEKFKTNKLYLLFLAYFLILTLANTTVVFYDTQERWLTSEGAEIGQWINDNLEPDSTFIFDKDDEIKSPLHKLEINNQDRPTYIAAYWIRGDWALEEINDNYDYIITQKDLEKEIIYIGNSGTKIYKT